MIPGVEIKLGDKVFTIAPLNFITLKKVAPLLKSFEKLDGKTMPEAEDFDAMITIIHLAIKRNHPEVTSDEIGELLDMQNVMEVITKIMGASGSKSAGEAKAGNA